MIENYEILNNGIIKQINIQPFTYDVDYHNQRYINIHTQCLNMSYLRYGTIMSILELREDFFGDKCSPIKNILDVGYGTGEFLQICNEAGKNCFGNNIVQMPLPSNVQFVEDIFKEKYDLITFFDSLEHMSDINFLHKLQTKYIAISVPWCHNINDEWFRNWKHRRENEHLWHFNENALRTFMGEQGYSELLITHVEDIIRKPDDPSLPNILTGIFIKDSHKDKES